MCGQIGREVLGTVEAEIVGLATIRAGEPEMDMASGAGNAFVHDVLDQPTGSAHHEVLRLRPVS